jgi:hypothetical protein
MNTVHVSCCALPHTANPTTTPPHGRYNTTPTTQQHHQLPMNTLHCKLCMPLHAATPTLPTTTALQSEPTTPESDPQQQQGARAQPTGVHTPAAVCVLYNTGVCCASEIHTGNTGRSTDPGDWPGFLGVAYASSTHRPSAATPLWQCCKRAGGTGHQCVGASDAHIQQVPWERGNSKQPVSTDAWLPAVLLVHHAAKRGGLQT